MPPDAQVNGQVPHDYRELLDHIARMRIDPRLRRRVDAEDVVQKTLIEANGALERFQAMNEPQRKGWLREILLNNLANELRFHRQQKRDLGREQPMDDVVEHSSVRLEALLAAEQSSPSERAHKNEMALRLDEALASLPERQRQAVVLRHYHDWSLAAIREHLETTQLAVVGLLHRGMMKLRDLLPPPE